MPYLRKVTKNGTDYFYMFHTMRNNGKFDKLTKYLGKRKPTEKELQTIKKNFMEEINEKKNSKNKNLISLLQGIQQRYGYLPLNELKKLSKKEKVPGTDIFGVVSFYSQFRLQKPAKYTISVCTGTACHVKGSEKILNFMEKHLGIIRNTTSKNGLIRLETVNCIGACAKAPAIMINEKIYGKVDEKKIRELIDNLK